MCVFFVFVCDFHFNVNLYSIQISYSFNFIWMSRVNILFCFFFVVVEFAMKLVKNSQLYIQFLESLVYCRKMFARWWKNDGVKKKMRCDAEGWVSNIPFEVEYRFQNGINAITIYFLFRFFFLFPILWRFFFTMLNFSKIDCKH